MPNHNSRRRQTRGRTRARLGQSETAIFHRALQGRNRETMTITRNLSQSLLIPSSSGGIINTIISMVPSNSFSAWANLSAEYDEVRVLGGRINVFCSVPNVTNTIAVTNTAVVVYDNDDNSTALTGLNNALDYGVKKQFAAVWDNNTVKSLTAMCYPIGSSSSGIPWASTAIPNQYRAQSFKLYSGGLTASTTYWSITVSLVCQFRGPV